MTLWASIDPLPFSRPSRLLLTPQALAEPPGSPGGLADPPSLKWTSGSSWPSGPQLTLKHLFKLPGLRWPCGPLLTLQALIELLGLTWPSGASNDPLSFNWTSGSSWPSGPQLTLWVLIEHLGPDDPLGLGWPRSSFACVFLQSTPSKPSLRAVWRQSAFGGRTAPSWSRRRKCR